LLLDAKRAGHITAVRPSLDKLQDLGFRLAQQTKDADQPINSKIGGSAP